MTAKTVLLDYPNRMRIDSVWLFISSDANGNEGVCGGTMPNGMFSPLIAADEDRLAMLRPMAKQIAGMTKKTVKLIRLTAREEIEVIEP